MSDENNKLTDEQRALIKAAIKEFMTQVYAGVGKSVLEKLFWIAVGALLFFYFNGHFPK